MDQFSKNCVQMTVYVRRSLAAGDHFLDPGDQLGLQLGGQGAAEHEEATEGDNLGADQVGTGVLDDLGDLISGSLIAVDEQSHVGGAGLVQLGAEAANVIGQLTLGGETKNHDALLVAGILGGEFAAGGVDGQLVLIGDHLSELGHAFLLGIVQNTHLDQCHNKNPPEIGWCRKNTATYPLLVILYHKLMKKERVFHK